MQTNTCENNKFMFYKMVHDKIYHNLVILTLCWIKCLRCDCEMGSPVLKQAGLQNWSVQYHFSNFHIIGGGFQLDNG